MKRSPLIAIGLSVLLFSLFAFGEESGAPVQIDPSIQNYAGLFTKTLSKKFVMGEIIDKRKNAGSDTLGATRTGRFVTSVLLCKPLPSAILQTSLAGMFRHLGALAEEKEGADFQIDAEVLDFSVEETNKVFSQQIKATVKFRIKVRTAESGALVNQFVIKAEDFRSAVDTTPFAVKVTANAVVSALQDLLESLTAL